MLTYILPRNWGDPSFDPVDSDAIANAAHMEQLVGTLTKMGPSGRYEPYLAESWTANDDESIWRFKLREGLTCSDGTPITAEAFVRSYQTILPLYAASTELPVFSKLRGWEKFLKGDRSALGIRAVASRELEFEFSGRAVTGFLQYLAMPYYGFYCPGNFEGGRWKNPKAIVSSGAYALERIGNDQSIVLSKRAAFPAGENAPDSVAIRRLDKSEALALEPRKTLIHTVLSGEEKIAAHWQRLTGVPTNLIGFAFGHQPTSPFSDRSVRQFIQEELLDSLPGDHLGSYSPARSFYFDAVPRSAGPKVMRSPPRTHFDGVVKILTGPQRDKSLMLLRLETMIGAALDKLGMKYEFFGLDPKDPEYNKRYTSNDEWHLRLFNVSSGSTPKNWVVRLMFCSRLGINFPDPSGKVCDLVNRFESRAFDQDRYVREFEEIVREDAAVVPLFHLRQTWLYSDDLDLSRVSATVDIPLFEAIGERR